MLKNVEVARDAMLGKKEERERTPGKIGFENHERAEPLQNAPHCYGHNSMLQQSCTLSAPPAKLKTYAGGADVYQKMIRGYTNVCSLPLSRAFTSSQLYRPTLR